MAVDCTAQGLADAAKCIECGVPTGMQFPVLIYLLCQMANNGIAPAFTQTGVSATSSSQIAHGLSSRPRLVEVVMVMKTAKAGCNIGDELNAEQLWNSTQANGFPSITWVAGTTNISISLGYVLASDSVTILGVNQPAGMDVTPGTDFDLTVRAWL